MAIAEKLFPGADPFILNHGGKYYLYCTTEIAPDTDPATVPDGFYVYSSDNLKDWKNEGLCLKKADVVGEKWFWAPEVYYYKGRFYMVYSAEEHLAVAVADRPTGPFTKLTDGWLREGKAIDGHLLFEPDGVYMYYVRLDGRNRIFVARLTPDLKAVEKEYDDVLVEAKEPWETVDCEVAEGPFVIKRGGKYYMAYSANHTRNAAYAVGYAVADKPTGPFVKYAGNPVLHAKPGVEGVGHNSFAPTGRDGEYICAYHCHSGNADFRPRMVCLALAHFETVNGEEVLKIDF